MFRAGQKVWHRDGRRSGVVLQVEDDLVFIEQDNGAEAEFRAADLTATPPAGKAGAGKPGGAGPTDPRAAYTVPTRTLTAAEITPEHQRVLGLVPVRTVQAVAALFERRPGARKWSGLGVAEKLNVIAEVTAVPYRTMREYSDRPGELGLLMGKGLADSQRAAGQR
jgi:hypothetical protein